MIYHRYTILKCNISRNFIGPNKILSMRKFIQRIPFCGKSLHTLNTPKIDNCLNSRSVIENGVFTRKYCSQFAFVPKHEPCSNDSIMKLQEFIDNSERFIRLLKLSMTNTILS